MQETAASADGRPEMRRTLWTLLFAPVDIAFLVAFRITFGALLVANVVFYFVTGFVEANYVIPRFHFTYLGFEWVRPWPGVGASLHFVAIAVLATCVALGLFYRACSLLLALGFTHLFLIDKAQYQNHYYLIVIMCWVLAVMPAHRAFSLDVLQRPGLRSAAAPAWALWLLRFQIGVPYFFGGIAKLDADWLAGAALRPFLATQTSYPLIGRYFTEEWCVQLFVQGGLWFDLLVVPGLLWRRTRVFAYAAAVGFHLMNHTLFHIGIFPWFMIFATLVFFPPGWPRRLLRLPAVPASVFNAGTAGADLTWSGLSRSRKTGTILLGTWVAFQAVWPLRYLASGENPNWTERGHFFAWHMMLRGKMCAVRFYVTDPQTGRTGSIDLRPYLTDVQLKRMTRSPDMVLDFVQFLAGDLREQGYGDVEIRALLLVSLNGRKPQLMIDPHVNLAAERRTFGRPDWIMPLVEPLCAQAWDVPLPGWERHLDLHLLPDQMREGRIAPRGGDPPGRASYPVDGHD
ncbi:MAG: HTTM domain-containing protein [Planctomycetaceae bacterium]